MNKRKPGGRDADSPGRAAAPTPVQPAVNDQSGSTGRATRGEAGKGKDTGQDRYGQTGHGGTHDRETMGQAQYRQSDAHGDGQSKTQSNEGSGRAEHEREEYGQEPAAGPPGSPGRDAGKNSQGR